MRYPMNAVVVRKTDNTLATSVFEQIKWAIEEQKVSHLFEIKVSPISDDLPLPRPPLATTLSMLEFLVAFHNGWKCLGIKLAISKLISAVNLKRYKQ
jgi:hypothetical protein